MISYELTMPAKGTTKPYVECTCLSTDTKPDHVANGSKLMEMDTATLYMFDEESKTWKEWS